MEKLLTGCFEHDPLYCKLIPDEEIRKRLLPELFACDLTEFYETCEIYSDSPEMNSLLVVSDETEPYNPLTYYLAEAWASLRTDEFLIKDPVEVHAGQGLPQLQMDGTAAPDRTDTHYLSGCKTGYAAPRPGCPAVR